jgi:hypothetical protein
LGVESRDFSHVFMLREKELSKFTK